MDILQNLKIRLPVWSVARRREFYTMASGFISDGKPVFDTLQVFEERWRTVRDSRAETIAQMMADMRGRNGKALRMGQAVGKWAPSTEAMAIDAGEQSGDIAEGLRMAARLADTQARVQTTLIGEMIYPGFLLLMFVALLFMLKTVVIPVFVEIAPRAKWPPSAYYMGLLAENAGLLTGLLIGSIVGIGIAFKMTRGRWVGETREFFDQWIPPWSIGRRITSAVMMSCFASFIKAGVPFSSILSQLSVTASDWEKQHLGRMRSQMRKGVRDGDAMAGSLFDEDIRWEIGVYGGMTNFGTALGSLSERVTTSVIARIQQFTAILRTLIMILVAGMIIWVYGSFFAITMAAKHTIS